MKITLRQFVVVICLFVFGPLLVYGQAPPRRSLTYVIPQPGAHHISPTTSLAIREGNPFPTKVANLDLFEVAGSETGLHTGKTVLSDDQLTLLFYPDEPFAYGETVSVAIGPGLTTTAGATVAETDYQFTVIDRPITVFPPPGPDAVYSQPRTANLTAGATEPLYYTHRELTNVMTATVTTPAQNTDDGLIFVASMGFIYDPDPALMILDNEGEPIYIQRTPDDQYVTDFKKQTVNGTDYLTYHVGVPFLGYTKGLAYVMNDRYEVIDSWTVGNGYGADLHELRLLDNGHAILLSYTPIPYNLQPYGGPANGTLVDVVLQEQDSAKNVVFEWHGSQHIPLTDSYIPLNSQSPVDFLHTNAVEVDDDGNWLISSRSTAEITKINRQTGVTIWRLGGKSNQFTFTNDNGFREQHHIRRLANGNITLFDNGNGHVPPHSRAVEYDIDEVAKTITRVWQYPDDTSEFSPYMGNTQRLGNGNTFIGWGGQPQLSEVRPNGTLALEMALNALSYRAFRFPWSGFPATDPHAVARYDSDPTAVTLYASWNGATDITGYEVYAGPTKASLSPVTTATRTGFETMIPLTGLDPDTCFFQVRPIHAPALVTPYSNLAFRSDLPVCLAQLSLTYLPAYFQ